MVYMQPILEAGKYFDCRHLMKNAIVWGPSIGLKSKYFVVHHNAFGSVVESYIELLALRSFVTRRFISLRLVKSLFLRHDVNSSAMHSCTSKMYTAEMLESM